MATGVGLRSRHGPLHKAILALLVSSVVGAVGCGGCSFSRLDGSSDGTDGARSEQLSSAPPSYELSLNKDQHFARRASYTMRGSDGRLVSGSYEEASGVVQPGRASDEKPLAYLNTRWKSSLGQDLTDVQLEFASSSPAPYDGREFGSQDSSSLFRFDLQRTGQKFGYGLKYFSVGEDFTVRGNSKSKLKADRQGAELWGQWALGALGIKPMLSRSHDNLEKDSNRPRLTDTQVGIRLDHSLLSWPYLGYSLSYLEGTRRSSREPVGYERYSGPISTAALSVNYSANKWNASLSSSRSDSKNTSGGGSNQNTTLSHYLSGSYYPSNTLSVTGALDHVRDEYKSYDASTLTNDASVSLSYKPTIGSLDGHLYVSYAAQKNPDWHLDTRYLSAGASQRWYLRRKPGVISVVSFDVAYDRYIDDIHSDASTEDLTFWLKFSHAFGARPLLAQTLDSWRRRFQGGLSAR